MRGCSASIQALTNCSRAFMLSPQRALSKPLNLYTFSSFRAKQTGAVCTQAAYICLLQKARSPQKKPRLRALCYPSSTNLNKEPLSLLLLFTLSQTASPDPVCRCAQGVSLNFPAGLLQVMQRMSGGGVYSEQASISFAKNLENSEQ